MERYLVLFAMLILTLLPAYPQAFGAGTVDLAITSVFWGESATAPITAHPGDSNVPLLVVITNAGDAAAWKVNGTLTLSYPFSYTYTSDEKVLYASRVNSSAGLLLPGYSFTLRYLLSIDSGAKDGVYRMSLLLSYKTSMDMALTATRSVDVPIWSGEIRVQRFMPLPLRIYPGDTQVNLRVWVVNSGIATAKDVNLLLLLTPGFKPSSSGSDSVFLGTMLQGQVSEANFYLDVDESALPGTHQLLLAVSSGSNLNASRSSIPLHIYEKAKFEVAAVEPGEVLAGDYGTVMHITLRNISNVTGESVRAQLKTGNLFSGTTTDYLGTIDAGENKTATFILDVDSKIKPGRCYMELRVEWTQDDKSLDQTSSIGLQILQRPLSLIYGAIVTVVAVVLAGVLTLRRRRSRQKV